MHVFCVMKRFWLVILSLWLCSVAFATDQPQSTGELPGLFFINTKRDKVCFSQGNLRCEPSSTPKVWSFAEHQYDILGTNNLNGSNFADVIDLIAWSGNKYNNYGVTNDFGTMPYEGTFVDWGDNKINNGGNKMRLWRTLSAEEWSYLLEHHDKKVVTIENVKGLVILPDNCSLTLNDLADTYTETTWQPVEIQGAVFLPTTGRRYNGTIQDINDGYYWTCTSTDVSQSKATCVHFSFINLNVKLLNTQTDTRSYGFAIRLVKIKEDCKATLRVIPNIPEAGSFTISELQGD